MKVMKMNSEFTLVTPIGEFKGKPGDYIVTDSNGNQSGYTREGYEKLVSERKQQQQNMWQQGIVEMGSMKQEEDINFINGVYNQKLQK